MKRFLLFLVVFVLAVSALAQDQHMFVSQKAQPLFRDKAWSQANGVYIFTPSDPALSLSFTFINNNPTSAHNFTFTLRRTPRPDVADYSNNTRFWEAYVFYNAAGGGCGTGALVIGASTSLSCSTGPMHGAQIAIQITGAGALGGSPDTLDVYIVQSVNNSQTVQSFSTGSVNGELLSTAYPQFSSRFTLFPKNSPSAATGNPLAALLFFQGIGTTNVFPIRRVYDNFNTGATSDNGFFGYGTLPIAQQGTQFSTNGNQGAPGTATNTFNANGGVPASNDWWPSFQHCTFMINVTAFTATSQDVYVQDSHDGTTWCDLLHFPQIILTNTRQHFFYSTTVPHGGSVSTAGNPAATACSDGTLAANSSIARGFMGRVRIKVVQVGAGAVTNAIYASCR